MPFASRQDGFRDVTQQGRLPAAARSDDEPQLGHAGEIDPDLARRPARRRGRSRRAMIDVHGQMGWQRRSGYNRRSLVETAMFRYKTIIGRRLQARTLSNQKTEAKIGCNVINRMATLGMPSLHRVH
jgi:hypothetical protein